MRYFPTKTHPMRSWWASLAVLTRDFSSAARNLVRECASTRGSRPHPQALAGRSTNTPPARGNNRAPRVVQAPCARCTQTVAPLAGLPERCIVRPPLSMGTMIEPDDEPHFAIPLPGGLVARVPRAVLEGYAVQGLSCVHADSGDDETVVSAHHLSVDAVAGSHDWHADWEFGECDYLDEAGFPQRKHTWHRHPFGTEYAELYT